MDRPPTILHHMSTTSPRFGLALLAQLGCLGRNSSLLRASLASELLERA